MKKMYGQHTPRWQRCTLLVTLAAFLMTGVFILLGTANPIATFVRKVFLPGQQSIAAIKPNSDDTPCANCAKQEQMLRRAQWLEKENQTLRAMVHLKEKPNSYPSLDCEIFAFGTEANTKTFWIDKGANHGISVNDPVVFLDTLIGSVTYVDQTMAQVTALIGSKNGVSAMIAETYDRAIVKPESGRLTLTFLSDTAKPKQGQMVQTSGVGICPAGFFIGTIETVRQTDSGGFCGSLSVETDYTTLTFVTVITNGVAH